MDKTQHPKALFKELRRVVDPLFKDGYLIKDFNIKMAEAKIGFDVAVVLYKASPEDEPAKAVWKGNQKALVIYVEEKVTAQAFFNMLKDYAQSKSLNARK